MQLEFTADQDELRDSVRAVLANEVPTSFVRAVVEEGAATADLWKHLCELDWPALTIPEDCGGIGLGFVELAVVVEELGRVIGPGPYLATVTQYAPLVRETGTDEQRRRFLGAVARGEVTGTIAVAEDGGSWAVEDVRATARPDGDGWILDGTKRFVNDGATADEIAVVARIAGGAGAGETAGIGVFVVPQSAVRSEALLTLDQSRQHATVELAGVRVDGDRALGTPGACADGVRRAIEEATVALALEMVGTCQSIFDVTLEYAKNRVQFDVPIGSFQAIKHKFADMFVALERARATAYFAAATLAEDDPRRSLAAAMAKAAAGDCQRLLTKEGIQIHGGIGYTWEHDMHLYVKRARSGDAVFGTASTQRQRVADLIGL
jgi:alkylation response protein AidB-like acyl-CoA dehydrogenase